MINVDLDNVLIDSLTLVERTKQVVSGLGVTGELYERAVLTVMREFGAYTPERHYAVLKRHIPLDGEFVRRVLLCAEAGGIVYPDTMDFLTEFGKENLTIVTSGDPNFQLLKIQANNLDGYVRSIIVTDDKPGSMKRPAAGDFFLDDAPRQIELVKQAHPQIFCIQMRQVPFWETEKTAPNADARVVDLREAAKIIRTKRRPQ